MATTINHVFQIPDGPHHPSQPLNSENFDQPVTPAPTEQFTINEHAQLRSPEYAPQVTFLHMLAQQHASDRAQAIDENRSKRGFANRLLGGRSLPVTVEDMVEAESRLGAQDLAPAPAGLERRFYYENSNDNEYDEWFYAQFPRPGTTAPSDTITIRYQVQNDRVLKVVEMMKPQSASRIAWEPLAGYELDAFQKMALTHYQRVSRELYGREPHHFGVSDPEQLTVETHDESVERQAKTGQEAVHQTVQSHIAIERAREKVNAAETELQAMIDDLRDEIEVEADAGNSHDIQVEAELHEIIAEEYMKEAGNDTQTIADYVERRAEEELAKHKTGYDLAA